MCDYALVAVKRWWVPHWLYGLFCPRLGTYQPFRWILHTKVDPFTNYRINGVYR
jgi:hypothetical protein